MEIPQPSEGSTRDLEFLFQFSPVNTSLESSDIASAATEDLPVQRGVTIKVNNCDEIFSIHQLILSNDKSSVLTIQFMVTFAARV